MNAVSTTAQLSAVPDFSEITVVVLGDVMLDQYVWGDVSRISPEAPVQVVRVDRKSYTLGGAGNVAANLAGLGCRTVCLGTRGDDEAGRILVETMGELPVNAILTGVPGRPTTIKTRVMSRGQQLLRLDEEQVGVLSEEVYDSLRAALADALAEAGALILSDYGKGVFNAFLAQEAVDMCRARGIPVLVDPKGADWTRYQGATCITPNTAEFLQVAQFNPDDEADLAARAATAINAFSLTHLMVTRGARGLSLFTRGGAPLHIPAEAREVFDVSGAGDTVIATLAAGLAAGLSAQEAAGLANAAAGVVVGKLGTQPIHRAELEESLLRREVGCGHKIRSRERAAQAASAWRKAGERVVFTNGCFDILHVGHISLLHQAAALGDRLVVGLNTDASVRRLKGESRPVLPEDERAALLAALECVDMVVHFDEDTPLELITAIEPDVLVKGGDYTVETVVGHELVLERGGRVEIVPLLNGKSTSGIIAKLKG
ncbi:Bifunctional protein hldE [Desulfovibrio sp. X2]|uniref:bifunctional D-glycero-beta-D-manno-heptose-7-phosphate kinase/D-glycero-beta-D-manno-heptose 1-phosphate adenylyltransferase HldE n=1 Tax=Desulfovibrio sp. X2 TaxID=941449 RepID=UPI0003587BA6|nr:bifunctional D-glycero-beta-D-manno-heptose-7-phosphate kinase/D-glycero-beta-D-manno-heptose 1-phosphate adenylyltransferase HldE [Desulfovibrio sp. X2]EPR44135.1 Bifunctional protein hldE [Desulfovibrio sp. X2]